MVAHYGLWAATPPASTVCRQQISFLLAAIGKGYSFSSLAFSVGELSLRTFLSKPVSLLAIVLCVSRHELLFIPSRLFWGLLSTVGGMASAMAGLKHGLLGHPQASWDLHPACRSCLHRMGIFCMQNNACSICRLWMDAQWRLWELAELWAEGKRR